MTGLNVLITGASGLVGYHAVKHLLAKGHNVSALIREGSSDDQLKALVPQPKIVRAELSDREGLARAMAGIDVVVHAAGSVDPLGKREIIRAINVDGTRTVLSAATTAGVKHFIHISSLSVITGQGDQYSLNEQAPLRYCGEPYADSKVDAEKLVMESKDIKVTALRPGFIYGPGERAWMPRLIGNIGNGKAMLIDGGTKETNVIYIENLCRAIEKAMMNERAYGQAYNLTDGQKISKKQLFDAISNGLGLPPVTKRIPGSIAKVACEVISTIAPVLPSNTRSKLSRFSRAAFRLAGVNQGFDISKAERDLHYTDRVAFEVGMRETLKTFAKTGSTKDTGKQAEAARR
jgi:2-alkyl-3-oxoalkanoate reductase